MKSIHAVLLMVLVAAGFALAHEVLYYFIGSGKDTLHQLVVLLGSLSATTGPFKLLPGPVHKLQLETAAGMHATGIDTLAYPSGAITVYAVAYDLYGSKRGRQACNWSVTGTLHQPSQTAGVSQVYYDASQSTGSESGLLIARALRSAALNDSTSDSLGILIKGPPSVLDSAVTRDMNGNGYLDEIELYFNNAIRFPPSFSLTNFTIKYTAVINGQAVTIPFSVAGMDVMDASNSRFILHLEENTTSLPYSPQTAWRPYISITGLENPPSVPPTQCRDGAGPVIWSVVKTVVNPSDRTLDLVRVTFSEPIQGPNGSPFSPANVAPQSVLNVFRKNSGSMTEFDTINTLSSVAAPNGIDSFSVRSFSRLINDSTLEFIMTNGKDLTSSDYLNINITSNQIFDNRSRSGGGIGMPPVVNNRVAQVKIISSYPDGGEINSANTNSSGKCGCGTGTGVAFLPPVGFRIASAVKKRRKKKSQSP